MESSVSSMRYHYMDNLRALAMMSGILFHAALAYSPFMSELWLSADTDHSMVLDCIAWFMHLFRMPLFFLISGFFAHYLVLKYGVWDFLKNRAFRILLPFIIFLPITLLSLLGVCFYAYHHLETHTVLVDYIVQAVTYGSVEGAYVSTSHLWFLYNLIWFCALAALLYRYIPYKLSEHYFMSSPLFLFCILPLVLVPSLLGRLTPLPAPGRLSPEWWAFGFFGVFFCAGWVFYKNLSWLDQVARWWPFLAMATLMTYVLYYQLIPVEADLEATLYDITHSKQLSLEGFLAAMATAVVSVYGTLLCLLLGYKYLNRESRFLRYIADSSYWVYIVHLPLLLFIQVHLLGCDWSLWVKYGVSVLGTVGIGLLSYAVIVRKSPIGWMLNGRKRVST